MISLVNDGKSTGDLGGISLINRTLAAKSFNPREAVKIQNLYLLEKDQTTFFRKMQRSNPRNSFCNKIF